MPSAPDTCLRGGATQATAEHAEREASTITKLGTCGRGARNKKVRFSVYHPHPGAPERSRSATLVMTRLPPQRENYYFSPYHPHGVFRDPFGAPLERPTTRTLFVERACGSRRNTF